MPILKEYKNELEYVEKRLRLRLDDVNYELDDYGKLTELSIIGIGLVHTDFLKTLTSLTYLNLSNNNIDDISFLKNLTSLKELDLSSNNITNIGYLENLISLEELDLSENNIININALANLISLSELTLEFNKIKNIKSLEKLTSLVHLDLDYNDINDINALANLTSLDRLYLSESKLTNYNVLKNMKGLKILYLENSGLRDIEFLRNLSNLRYLNISNNEISDIRALKWLENLNELYLNHNNIKDLSSLFYLKNLKKIRLHKNPSIENENLELKKNHIGFLKLWLEKNNLKDKEFVLFPKKVVFLGNHAAGKSSLLNYFEKNIYSKKTETTHVLNILKWEAKNEDLKYIKSLFTNKYTAKNILPVMFYDFGGQDFYHGLYQSFSSKTAFQIVVYCADQTAIELVPDSKGYLTYKYPLSFWLKEKEYLEREAQNPYFIVENKIDAKDEKAFVKDFPDIQDFENPKGIFHVFLKALREENFGRDLQNKLQLEYLKKQLLQELYEEKEVSASMTAFFQDIYNDSTKSTLKIKDREDYVVDGISEENMLTQLRLLENSGVLFLSERSQQVITNPQAFIKYIHNKVLKQEALFDVCGRLTSDEWKELNNGVYKKLIEDFMLKQKTMFYDKDAQEYVFPNYLSLYSEDEERHFLTVSESLLAFSIQLQYFLPFGFINVLIHHFGKEPNKKKFWRDAIYFIKHVNGKPKANVFIILNIKELRIDVYVEARDPEFDVERYKRYLWLCLANMYEQRTPISWEAFLELKKNPKPEKTGITIEIGKQLFPKSKFPKTAKVSTDGKFYTSLAYLEKRIDDGEYDIYLDTKEGRSSRLPLHQFQLFTERSIKKMNKIFISYSSKDIHYKQELERFLKPLTAFQLAQSWSCEELNAELWHDKIQEELESSDIVIFMMSMNFASSEYILKDEVYKTFKDMEKNPKKKILCVLVRQFPWKLFSKYKDVLKLDTNIFTEDAKKVATALAELPEHQFLPYYIEEGAKKGENARYIKPLNQWEFPEEAYTQIINKLSGIL